MPVKNKVEETPEVIVEDIVEVEEIEEGEEEELVTESVEDGEFRDSNGDEILFPDGPKMALVEEWKSRFGGVFLTEFEDDVFIWRTLIRKEYKDIMKVDNADTYYKEERICEKCVLWPLGYTFLKMTHGKAGIPSLLAEQVMEKSGFTARVGAMKI